ncbi:hypothetical protein, partial [Thalassoglobus neptunius]|uniref:hypothetical protein n=1 Tax=Thalassoglobus neptunius TaxID=1938619 RepID=UPI001E4145AF
ALANQRRNNLYRHSRPRRSHPSTGFLINNSAPFFARRALRFLTDVYTCPPLGLLRCRRLVTICDPS